MATYQRIRERAKEMNIVGGAIHPECIYLLAQNYYNPKKHKGKYNEWNYPKDFHIYLYLPIFREEKDEWGAIFYGGMEMMRTPAIMPQKNMAFTGVMYDGDVIRQKDHKKGSDSFKWDESAVGKNVRITDVAVINDKIYACGTKGRVFKRKSNLNWEQISENNIDFWSIDGFSEKEIYVGGENGILWLKKGKEWKQIEIPCDKKVQQILCASDGNVYLNCCSVILKGREDKWEILDLGKINDIRKIAWFKEQLYILPKYASSSGLYVFESGKITEIELGKTTIDLEKMKANETDNLIFKHENISSSVSIPAGMNTMISNNDLLMITGDNSVILFDGNRWFNLFDKNKTEEELRASGTFYDPREL